MIAAVVLAAGGSARLGAPKQLERIQGRSLLGRSVNCSVSAGCRPVVVVLGASVSRIRPALRGHEVDVVVNAAWREGLASSIRAGIGRLGDEVEAALLVACDQTRLDPEVLGRLIDAFDGKPGRIVACEYAGTLGVPALFGRARFGELLALRGDRGAKPLLRRYRREVIALPWPDGAFDLDRPEDRPEG